MNTSLAMTMLDSGAERATSSAALQSQLGPRGTDQCAAESQLRPKPTDTSRGTSSG